MSELCTMKLPPLALCLQDNLKSCVCKKDLKLRESGSELVDVVQRTQDYKRPVLLTRMGSRPLDRHRPYDSLFEFHSRDEIPKVHRDDVGIHD
ncbi:hypothetical protein RJT34_17985 [Clitoria ternatea]|uniref:Uncharacterized protein n=1 Tax=Clitoria ternatea TaxID=43366 RepID=A0AAN9PFD7_CLITE